MLADTIDGMHRAHAFNHGSGWATLAPIVDSELGRRGSGGRIPGGTVHCWDTAFAQARGGTRRGGQGRQVRAAGAAQERRETRRGKRRALLLAGSGACGEGDDSGKTRSGAKGAATRSRLRRDRGFQRMGTVVNPTARSQPCGPLPRGPESDVSPHPRKSPAPRRPGWRPPAPGG